MQDFLVREEKGKGNPVHATALVLTFSSFLLPLTRAVNRPGVVWPYFFYVFPRL